MSIIFSRKEEYETGEELGFIYEGKSPSVEVTQQVTDQIKIFMSDPKGHDNMHRNVTYLRTILKDCEEELFVISYLDALGNNQVVKYTDGQLFYYKSIKNIDNMTIKVENSKTEGFKVSFCNIDENYIEYSNSKKINDQINYALMTISSLKNIRMIGIDEDSKSIINIYKLFFKENPDFSSKDINLKIQSMMNILYSFNYKLDDSYNYCLYRGREIPISMKLDSLISTLRPLGNIVDVEDNLNYKEKERKVIEFIGEIIREDANSNDDLKDISKAIYIDREYNNITEDLLSSINMNSEQINENITKFKRIKERVNKE